MKEFGSHPPGAPLPPGAVGSVEITEKWPLFAVKQLHPRTDFNKIRIEVVLYLLVYAVSVIDIVIAPDTTWPLPFLALVLFVNSCLLVYSVYQALLLSTCSFILKRYIKRMKEEYYAAQGSQGQL